MYASSVMDGIRRLKSSNLSTGVCDFLSCPFKETDLLLRIQRLLYQRNSTNMYDCMSGGKKILNRELLVGESESFLQEIRKIPLYAHSDTPVLISGETGTSFFA